MLAAQSDSFDMNFFGHVAKRPMRMTKDTLAKTKLRHSDVVQKVDDKAYLEGISHRSPSEFLPYMLRFSNVCMYACK